ncbi:low temperature requirement protein A [Micromonospora sp. 4G57]|uniref:Low temperature requirement protein A n=1 Tax=Micromonospora sicca TaxID=2202420 RepID=A0ABU5JQC6_9ACTN|nr:MULTISPECIES: low temperature requirement protein A [unclassified Micromonospora]MDZ5447861.1 low temperature requirement protein A [Micromonospora sp. 4G57]MDZ5494594.1 low temperature requirement protein A [Micromonospora sp. 4G53]
MTTGGSTELVRRPSGSTRATLLELLLDVVFVAALALTSMLIAERDSWAGVAPVVRMLMAVWWTWSVTSTTTDFYDPDQRPIRAILMVTMFGAVVMAAALASDAHALIFAAGYVTPHVWRGLVLVSVLHQHRHQAEKRAARFLFWFLVSGVFWIVGALLPDAPRWTLWTVAVAIDYVSAAARYPTPWLGRVPVEQYEKTTEHLGERYQQFVILALGDIILVPTLKISTADFTRARLAAFLAAFVTMLLLWQIYVLGAGSILRMSWSAQTRRRLARLAPYTHLVMLAGVVCTAAGFDLVLDRPTGDTPARWTALILGGPALFLLGRTLFTYRIAGIVPWHRVLWVLVLAAAAPWVGGWPPVLVTTLVVLVLAGVVVGDAMGGRLTRPMLRGRPG